MTQPITVGDGGTRNGRWPEPGPTVAVVFEPGRRGAGALVVASRLATSGHDRVAVVAIATQASSGGCGISAAAYNGAVRDAAADELGEARRRLGARGAQMSFVMLVEGLDPPLPAWVSEREIRLVLLPARRRLRSAAGHPAARGLRRIAGVEVRVL